HVAITNAEIDQRVAQFKQLLGGPDPARAATNYAQFLKANGLTAAQHRDQLIYTMLTEKLALKANPVSDADLERVQIRYIACNTREKAQQVLRELGQRANFELLVRTESDDPNAKVNEGLMEPFIR